MFNEKETVRGVVITTLKYVDQVVLIDDGSTDLSSEQVSDIGEVHIIRHNKREGYGKSLIDGFKYCESNNSDFVITIDSDGQHDANYIPKFIEKSKKFDIVSGSRMHDIGKFPESRLSVHLKVRDKIQPKINFKITDVFCGFKCYNMSALKKLNLTATGYELPLQLILEASKNGLSWCEINVPNIYYNKTRNFNKEFISKEDRLRRYLKIIGEFK